MLDMEYLLPDMLSGRRQADPFMGNTLFLGHCLIYPSAIRA